MVHERNGDVLLVVTIVGHRSHVSARAFHYQLPVQEAARRYRVEAYGVLVAMVRQRKSEKQI